MSQQGDIYLGTAGSETLLSPFGRKLKISDVELAREERTASGRLVKDVIATKKKFTLSYEMIDGDELETLLGLYDGYSELSLLLYNDRITETTTPEQGDDCDSYTVIMEPIDRERIVMIGDGLWGGASVELNEV